MVLFKVGVARALSLFAVPLPGRSLADCISAPALPSAYHLALGGGHVALH